MMTKKDFEGLADALALGADAYGFEFVVRDVADWCASQTPRFDREKFEDRVFKDVPPPLSW